jgi:hypothetical protein
MSTTTHILKVQDVGDYYQKKVKPKIKLEGAWLLDAGLEPDRHVEVTNPVPGVLILRSMETQ